METVKQILAINKSTNDVCNYSNTIILLLSSPDGTVSYSVVWGGIMQEATTRSLYTSSDNNLGKLFLREKKIIYSAAIRNVGFQLKISI